jgi:hemerythrin-like domain-containing protein
LRPCTGWWRCREGATRDEGDRNHPGRASRDHALLGALFYYIEQFPERLHHPKEDDFLFARLRVRRPDAAPLLDGLQREHAIGRERCDELKAMWERFRADPAALPPFAEGVERYSHFHWLHMRKEEERVRRLAAEALTNEDWDAIDAAFASNDERE